MRVSVKLFATIRKYQPQLAPGESLSLEVLPGTSVGQLLARLRIPAGAAVVAVLNGRVRGRDHVLSEGDVLSVFPPVAGG